MANDKIFIYDHESGQQIEREMTAEEQAERDLQVATWQTAEAIKKEEMAKAIEQKAAAEAKLAALGLTAEDLKALGLA